MCVNVSLRVGLGNGWLCSLLDYSTPFARPWQQGWFLWEFQMCRTAPAIELRAHTSPLHNTPLPAATGGYGARIWLLQTSAGRRIGS
jgi:hypothetical protein